MSTRAAIGFVKDSKIVTIYSHYDGYPKHVGRLLQKFFRSQDHAENLVYGTDIRQFKEDGSIERFPDGGYAVADTPCEAADGFDYLYLFDRDHQEWACFSRSSDLPVSALTRVSIPE